jgi:hypothetical protein
VLAKAWEQPHYSLWRARRIEDDAQEAEARALLPSADGRGRTRGQTDSRRLEAVPEYAISRAVAQGPLPEVGVEQAGGSEREVRARKRARRGGAGAREEPGVEAAVVEYVVKGMNREVCMDMLGEVLGYFRAPDSA